jgi:hypothetical protein
MDDVALIDVLAAKMAHAIALAEGFYVEGSLPARIFNPGDMKLGDRGYGTEQEKTVYLKADPNADIEDRTDGFSALRRECTAILTDTSENFPASDTFAQVALKWTGSDKPGAWCKIVTDTLNVNPLDTIANWVKAE